MNEYVSQLINWLNTQVGYFETGDNNTKYADDTLDSELYGFDMHGKPWCDYFVDYAFVLNFGYDKGTRMTYQYPNASAACAISEQYYKDNNAFYKVPQLGDQVFFYVNGGTNHTGIVVDISDSTITTVEGNSGDQVRKNTYYLTDRTITGYGRPNWALLCGETLQVKELEDYILKNGSGMNNPLPLVFVWQGYLVYYGCYDKSQPICKFVDGEFGCKTEQYTKLLQEKLGLPVTGVVGKDDWTAAEEGKYKAT